MNQSGNNNKGADQAARSVRRFLDAKQPAGRTVAGPVSTAIFRSVLNIVADVSGGAELPLPKKEELARVVVKQGGMATFELYIDALLGGALSNNYCWSEILDRSMIPSGKSLGDVAFSPNLALTEKDQAAFSLIKSMDITKEQAAGSVKISDTANGVVVSYVTSYFSALSNSIRGAKREEQFNYAMNPDYNNDWEKAKNPNPFLGYGSKKGGK